MFFIFQIRIAPPLLYRPGLWGTRMVTSSPTRYRRLTLIVILHFVVKPLSSLPGWATIMGFQFENLVLHNRSFIWDRLGICPEDIVFEGPFFQHSTSKQPGCQIDYLIQTRFNTLFACEVKFSRKEIKTGIVEEVKEKLRRLVLPRGFSCCPVLIHVSGVQDAVIDRSFCTEVIDFCEGFER